VHSGGAAPDSESPAAGGAGSPTIRHAGARTFLCDPERCTDTRYVPDTMQPETIPFPSPRYEQILAEHPSWAVYFSLAKETILVADEATVYRFVLTQETYDESDPVIVNPTPTATQPDSDDATGPTPTPADSPSLSRPVRDLCTAPFLLLVPVAAIALRKSFG
jgi:hypothetical protein